MPKLKHYVTLETTCKICQIILIGRYQHLAIFIQTLWNKKKACYAYDHYIVGRKYIQVFYRLEMFLSQLLGY